METNDFPPPETPRSGREVLAKALEDEDYAAFIHEQVRLAREGTAAEKAAALANIDAQFMLSDEELAALDLPAGSGRGSCASCTETRPNLFLLDFATKTPSWSASEEST